MKVPSKRTLAKYGLSEYDFRMLYLRDGGLCGVCDEYLERGRVFIDHEHVRGFTRMPPAEKRKHVRGLLHYQCNRYLVAKNTLDTIDMVVTYLNRKRAFA
jgi:hypothetical protein